MARKRPVTAHGRKSMKTMDRLPPEILDAMRVIFERGGYVFQPEGLARFAADESLITLVRAMGWPVEEAAKVLVGKILAADIEQGLHKCVRAAGEVTLVSMTLEDLRFAYGFLPLEEAEVSLTADQFNKAIDIVCKLART